MFRKILIMIKSLAALLGFSRKGNADYSLTLEDIMPMALRDDLFADYNVAMGKEQTKYPHDQMNYDRDEFEQACDDPEIIKAVFRVNDDAAGFAFLTRPVATSKAPWVSPTFNWNAQSGLYYITILMMRKNYRGAGHVIGFMEHLYKELTTAYPGLVVGFDVPTNGKEWLYKLIFRRIGKRFGVRVTPIGSQKYFRMEQL
ncbi:hypothetical protein KKC88_06025 [Patescibacteria group bacterium]|nr:hypothetical protein [Patescibacteria group bacterium]MBU1673959.1 hypothetical protein [Patescibacteria group bacterium]MBU1963953.1 hypothetical protein [Patescibacteria group bacterium]